MILDPTHVSLKITQSELKKWPDSGLLVAQYEAIPIHRYMERGKKVHPEQNIVVVWGIWQNSDIHVHAPKNTVRLSSRNGQFLHQTWLGSR